MAKRVKFKVGDSVVVKSNVKDPDLGIDIGGWQGRISEVDEDENLVCIDWDSITLKKMPASSIEKSEEEGLEWQRMYLYATDVEPAASRDSEEDVEWSILDAWDTHLREVLKFPIKAQVSEPQERGPLRAGDRVNVHRIVDIEEGYGIIVELRRGRRKYYTPLCDLEVEDKKSPNYQPVKDYAVWFANQ